MFNCAVKIISWFLLVVDSLAPKCPNQTEKLKTRMLSISHQDKMLAITSKVDICTKRCTSCSRCIFNSNLSHQEVERDGGDDIKSKQSCEMANWRSSRHHWMFFKTPGDISIHFYSINTGNTGGQTIKTGVLNQAVMFFSPYPRGCCV